MFTLTSQNRDVTIACINPFSETIMQRRPDAEVTSVARVGRYVKTYLAGWKSLWIALRPTTTGRSFYTELVSDPLTMMHTMLTAVIAWWALTLDFGPEMPPVLSQIMAAPAWHLTLTFGAIIGLFGIMNPKLRRFSTQVLSMLHGIIAFTVIVYKPLEPWAAPYATLAFFSGYLCWMRRS